MQGVGVGQQAGCCPWGGLTLYLFVLVLAQRVGHKESTGSFKEELPTSLPASLTAAFQAQDDGEVLP